MLLVFAIVNISMEIFYEMRIISMNLEYPEKNRCSVEIIKDMDMMVVDLLQVLARSCGNTLPNRIVFYRDGVDDGQYQKVLDNEVNKVKSACQSKQNSDSSVFLFGKLIVFY